MDRRRQDPFFLFFAAVTLMCSFFDLWYTLHAIDYAGARELNPFFRLLLSRPLYAFLYKFVAIPGLVLLLYELRRHRAARTGLWICCFAFVANTVVQLLNMYRWW